VDEKGRRNAFKDKAYLGHAVYGYFQNGGGRCYVDRVTAPTNGRSAGASKPAMLELPGRSPKGLMSLGVAPKATPAADIQIVITPPTGEEPAEGTFTLGVKMNDVEELYENVTLGRRGPKSVVETVNQASRLVTLTELQTGGSLAERTPAVGSYTLRAPDKAALVPTKVQPTHFVGDVAARSGLEGFEIADEITMIACPDLMSALEQGIIDLDGVKSVQLAMIAHCERLKNRVAILDTPPGLDPQQAMRWRERDTNYDSKFAAVYYPWVSVSGPDGKPMNVPPSGHIAGVYARNDMERGVHKAPANEVVQGALGPATPITKGEQDMLNPMGVNCIRSFTGRGTRVWGARTLSSDPAWRYVNVRRLFNYVEASIEHGTQWVVFEPNDADLWARVRRDVGAFLTGVWRDGALFGSTPAEAFFVKVDEENNPQDVRDRGQLVIDVGIAPVKPAEFVIFRFSQYTNGGA
jgi:hypothetical protein